MWGVFEYELNTLIVVNTTIYVKNEFANKVLCSHDNVFVFVKRWFHFKMERNRIKHFPSVLMLLKWGDVIQHCVALSEPH